jgi:hypothetical protein
VEIARISLVENDTVEYCFSCGIFKLEQGGGLDFWSAWRLALDDVKQPQESCNIIASTRKWLVYISNGVLISAAYIFVYIGIKACLGCFRVSYAFFTLGKQ